MNPLNLSSHRRSASLLSAGIAAVFLNTSCQKVGKVVDEARSRTTTTIEAGPAASTGTVIVELAEAEAEAEAEPIGTCPPDMVKVTDRFCVDRYEAIMLDTKLGRRANRHYHPSRYSVENRYKFFKEADEAWEERKKLLSVLGDAGVDAGVDAELEADAGPPTLFKMAIPKPESWQFEEYFRVKAVSEAGQLPNAFISGVIAEDACNNAGKRLCTEDEWVTACRGENDTKFPYGDTYEEGACNIYRQGHVAKKLHGHYDYMSDSRLNLVPLHGEIQLEKTGNRSRCVSRWGDDGIYDMVGNLDEWIDDPQGTFVGGFYSHQTDKGCEKKETAHITKYYDYSLGARCCKDLSFDQD